MKYHGKLLIKCKAGYRMIQLCRLIAHHQGAVHTPHIHTHTFAHSCLGRRMSALCNLAAWEMFVFMSQTHSGRGQDPGFTGLYPTRVLQGATWNRLCLWGSTAWSGWGGEGEFAGGQAPWGAQLRHMGRSQSWKGSC